MIGSEVGDRSGFKLTLSAQFIFITRTLMVMSLIRTIALMMMTMMRIMVVMSLMRTTQP